MSAVLTRHAVERMSQRCFGSSDLALIMLIGTEVDDGFLVRTKDCQAAERELKHMLSQIRRLEGKRVVVADGRVITAYRATAPKQQRLLRDAERRTLAK